MTIANNAIAGVAPGVAALDIHGLTKGFTASDGERFLAVDGIDLTIKPGEVVAFLGPNGAGKSTTIDMILGLTRPDDGQVTVFGLSPDEAVRSGRVAAVMQTRWPPAGPHRAGHRRTDRFPVPPAPIPRMRSAAPASTSCDSARCPSARAASSRSLRFALALLPKPDLLILDEPTAGMDVDARRRFWADVRADAKEGTTVLFATHYLEEAEPLRRPRRDGRPRPSGRRRHHRRRPCPDLGAVRLRHRLPRRHRRGAPHPARRQGQRDPR